MRLVSLTHPPTSPKSSSPICVRVLVRGVGPVGTVEKVFFGLLIFGIVHDIVERGFVRVIVDQEQVEQQVISGVSRHRFNRGEKRQWNTKPLCY